MVTATLAGTGVTSAQGSQQQRGFLYNPTLSQIRPYLLHIEGIPNRPANHRKWFLVELLSLHHRSLDRTTNGTLCIRIFPLANHL